MKIDQHLAGIAELLEPRIPVVRVSLREQQDDAFRIVGLWTLGPTLVDKGAAMHVAATSLNEFMASQGDVVVRNEVVRDAGLAEDIVANEGVRSFVSVALKAPTGRQYILSVSASRPNVFTPDVVEEIVSQAKKLETSVVSHD
ncbi:MAG: hypothetical protein ACYDCC_10565 [Actinomycetota bacterium]